ncbi:unnamed protein product [Dibothriocephalus latus]|uniref:Uncharacterized protein n=1 Tax=Dibothriocephalus latus TaxID=60516 RepID=A0A3P7RR93_DIBLA|nr:unnamed protein product [Dibothriocephalus latus]
MINRESLSSHTFDVELLGDCDVVLDELSSRLGWRVPLDGSVPLEETIVPPAAKRTEVDLRVPLKAAVMSRHPQETSVPTQEDEAEEEKKKKATEEEEKSVESSKTTIETPSDLQSTTVAESASSVEVPKATAVEPAGPNDATTVTTTKSDGKVGSQPSGDSTGTGGESSPIDVDRLVDSDDFETDFHLAKFLQGLLFASLLPLFT